MVLGNAPWWLALSDRVRLVAIAVRLSRSQFALSVPSLDVSLSFKFHDAKRLLVTAVFSLELWQRCVAYTREVVFAGQDGVLVKNGKSTTGVG